MKEKERFKFLIENKLSCDASYHPASLWTALLLRADLAEEVPSSAPGPFIQQDVVILNIHTPFSCCIHKSTFDTND